MKFSEDIQTLLPLGYLYLVILGILKESFFYYQFGINILKYSTIMDILISPIAEFTSNPITLVAILGFFTFHLYLPKLLLKFHDKKTVQKIFELKSTAQFSQEQTKNYYNMISLKMFAIVLLSFFIGTGIGSGYFALKDLENNKAKYNYKLSFNSGESEQICLIGTNSIYYFYAIKGSKTMKITPIAAVKNIEKSIKGGLFSK